MAERSTDAANWTLLNNIVLMSGCGATCVITDPNPVPNSFNFYRVFPRMVFGADVTAGAPGLNHDGPRSVLQLECVGACIPLVPAAVSNPPVNGLNVQLAWADGQEETGYKIERNIGGTWTEIATVAANVTSYTASNPSYSTTYTFRIRAFNTHGESPYSNIVYATTDAPPVPGDLSVSPGSIAQWEPYTITVQNAPNMTLNVEYYHNGAGPYYEWGWPTLDGNGQHVVDYTGGALGTYVFTKIQNAAGGDWVFTSEANTVTVTATPTGLSIENRTVSKTGAGGLPGCYKVLVSNGSNMLVDVQVTLPDTSPWTSDGWPQLDAGGASANICVDSGTPTGRYTFLKVKNHVNALWWDVYDYVDVVP
jgi:hypothetical protein